MTKMFSMKLTEYCNSLVEEFKQVDRERIVKLEQLADYIGKCLQKGREVNLLFVCTHNSRRSQFAQVWAEVAAAFYDIENISAFSGGTETTRIHKSVIKSLERAGLESEILNEDNENPVFRVSYGRDVKKTDLRSKLYSDPVNPQSGFATLMVCSDADEACPFIPGADVRISIPFTDPKYSDNTSEEDEIYDLSSRVIAREMFWAFSLI